MKIICAVLLSFLLFFPQPFNFEPVGVSGITELTQESGHLHFVEGSFRENEKKEEVPYEFQNVIVLQHLRSLKNIHSSFFSNLKYSSWHGLSFHKKTFELHAPHRGPPSTLA